MSVYRYSRWDGTDPFGLDKEELMDELSRNLMEDGDLSYALWKMRNWGLNGLREGRQFPSLQELIQRLQRNRQSRLQQYKLNSIMDGIREKLDDILATERQGIQKHVDEAHQKGKEGRGDISPEMQANLQKAMEEMAKKHLEKLDKLPPDAAGQIKGLSKYDFMDKEAERKFKELKDSLTKNALESFTRDLAQRLKGMDANDIAAMKRMIQEMNRMMEQRLKGQEPDFNSFMKKYGQNFGSNPPQNMDELMEMLQDQIAQAQALFNSMSPEQRRELEDLLNSMLDESTKREMARFAANLEALNPRSLDQEWYPFSGEEPISFSEALKLMEQLQKMDKLESQLKTSQYSRSLDNVDRDLVRDVMGEAGEQELESIDSITRILEEAGYIRLNNGKFELTPRGMRKIGQKAMKDIFAQLRKDQVGSHTMQHTGFGGERQDETKKYEFGDPLHIHLEKTIMNALYRESQTPPVKLDTEDFEVFKTEQLTRTATVLMLDLSLSMPMFHNFEAAKRVAVALDELIRSQFPQDKLYLVGFSTYAKRLKKEELLSINWNELDPYTNIQQGLFLARKLLSRERCSNKNVILISDGEPTAHVERGSIYVRYPPSPRTLAMTLEEVKNCTQKGIIVNTFMLRTNDYRGYFVSKMAQINKGRVFFTSADKLGQYILKDYITGKQKKL